MTFHHLQYSFSQSESSTTWRLGSAGRCGPCIGGSVYFSLRQKYFCKVHMKKKIVKIWPTKHYRGLTITVSIVLVLILALWTKLTKKSFKKPMWTKLIADRTVTDANLFHAHHMHNGRRFVGWKVSGTDCHKIGTGHNSNGSNVIANSWTYFFYIDRTEQFRVWMNRLPTSGDKCRRVGSFEGRSFGIWTTPRTTILRTTNPRIFYARMTNASLDQY